ncbi:MAG: PhoH family protein [Lactobacillales bacterium]|nr:PhoH family protein [Lactobacillales bacterium]
MIHAEQTLNTVKRIGFVHFDDKDVVRHPVVAEIIRAYNLKGGI